MVAKHQDAFNSLSLQFGLERLSIVYFREKELRARVIGLRVSGRRSWMFPFTYRERIMVQAGEYGKPVSVICEPATPHDSDILCRGETYNVLPIWDLGNDQSQTHKRKHNQRRHQYILLMNRYPSQNIAFETRSRRMRSPRRRMTREVALLAQTP